MNTIIQIYGGFTVQEKKEFARYLKDKNRRNDTKNLALLKLLDKGKVKNAHTILYPNQDKGAFHALCKRVQDSLVDFVASQSFANESQKDMETLKLLLASRLFFEKKYFKTAFKTLGKAEQKAKTLENFSILSEIYHTKMQYAHANPAWSLKKIIWDYELNKVLLEQDFQLNMAYANIKENLVNTPKKPVQSIVGEAFSHFKVKINQDLTYKSVFQLMEITATLGKLQRDFYSIAPYMMDLFNAVREKGEVPLQQQYYYLNILYLLAVTDFRNKKFDSSQCKLLEIEDVIKTAKKGTYHAFKEKLGVMHALNALFTSKIEEALTILKLQSKTSLNAQLLLAMCYFQKEQFSEANTVLIQLNKNDAWYEKKMDWIWVLKKNIMEILLYIELDKLELVLNRLNRFSKNFGKQLRAIGEERVLIFMDLVKAYYEAPHLATEDSFKDSVENSFDWVGNDQEDIFVMSFYAWLKSKIEGKKLYQVTLELVS